MLNVGISEQQVFWMGDFGRGNALADRPQFSSPAGRRACRSDDAQPLVAGGRIGDYSTGAFVAVIFDDLCAERPVLVLPQQRCHAARDAFGFVARRNDYCNGRPRIWHAGDARIVPHAGTPVGTPPSDQVDPDRGTDDCNHNAHRHALFARVDRPASTSITTLSSTRLLKHLTM